MPQLIKNVEGTYIEQTVGSIKTLQSISGVVKLEDYVDLFGFTAYLQNFTKVEETAMLINPINFGLKNKFNLPIKSLEIDY